MEKRIYVFSWLLFIVATFVRGLQSTTQSASSVSSCFNDNNVIGRQNPDYIEHLPGYNQPLPSNWYSGYVSYEFYNRTVHTHYVFVEAEDTYDDIVKPIIYWSSKFLQYVTCPVLCVWCVEKSELVSFFFVRVLLFR